MSGYFMGIYKEHSIECEHARVNPEDYSVGTLNFEAEEPMRNDAYKKRKMYQNAANVASPRFSRRQRREHITLRELKMRMRDIRKTGYDLGRPYSNLDKPQLWELLGEVRSNLRTKLQ